MRWVLKNEMKKIGRLHDWWYLPDAFHNGKIGQVTSKWKPPIMRTDWDTDMVEPSF